MDCRDFLCHFSEKIMPWGNSAIGRVKREYFDFDQHAKYDLKYVLDFSLFYYF